MDQDRTIRGETRADFAAIHELNQSVFGRRAEADLVDRLRETARPFVSLVSEEGRTIIGHVAFSPVTIERRPDLLMGLGPLAVRYEWRRRGIGEALVRRGLEVCGGIGAAAVVVLGDPGYYGRFGFVPAEELGLRCPFEAPPGFFGAVVLRSGEFDDRGGLARYHPAFDAE